jgi:hypothetical protein
MERRLILNKSRLIPDIVSISKLNCNRRIETEKSWDCVFFGQQGWGSYLPRSTSKFLMRRKSICDPARPNDRLLAKAAAE